MNYNEQITILNAKSNEATITIDQVTIKIKRTKILAFILKEIRNIKGYTQNYVAEKINIAQNQYGRYESGETQPSIEIIIRLANLYNVSTDYLIGKDTINHDFSIEEKYNGMEKNIEKTQILKIKMYITQLQLIYAKINAEIEEKINAESDFM